LNRALAVQAGAAECGRCVCSERELGVANESPSYWTWHGLDHRGFALAVAQEGSSVPFAGRHCHRSPGIQVFYPHHHNADRKRGAVDFGVVDAALTKLKRDVDFNIPCHLFQQLMSRRRAKPSHNKQSVRQALNWYSVAAPESRGRRHQLLAGRVIMTGIAEILFSRLEVSPGAQIRAAMKTHVESV
jgi:hypothetical protein